MSTSLATQKNTSIEEFYGTTVAVDKTKHKLTYKLGEKERMQILANLLIDKILDDHKNDKLQLNHL